MRALLRARMRWCVYAHECVFCYFLSQLIASTSAIRATSKASLEQIEALRAFADNSHIKLKGTANLHASKRTLAVRVPAGHHLCDGIANLRHE